MPEEATWLDQGDKNPHSAAHFGRYAFKPSPALAYVDRGLDAYLGTTVWLEAHWQNPFELRPAEDRTALQRFGDLTAALVLQLLIPLFIVLLAFPTFAGERESGTLRLLLSAGAEPRQLALGKAMGLAGALFVVLVPAALLGGLLLVVGFPSSGVGDQLGRAGRMADDAAGGVVVDMQDLASYEYSASGSDSHDFSITGTMLTDTVVLGDTDGDGAMTEVDAIHCARIGHGIEPVTPQALASSDMNSDSKLDVLDAILIMRRINGFIP